MNRALLFVVVSYHLVVVGCGYSGSSIADADPPFPNPGPSQSDIKIVSSTIFLFQGQKCQLLGVSESADPNVREQALRFTTAWFEKIGNYIGVYNSSNPLRLADGTCVVWVRGYDMYLSCLNVELVRAGLVQVDYKEMKQYSFTEPTKDGEAVADWKGDLEEAAKGYERGEKPKVLFDWPGEREASRN
jgi:hypothetical protein